MFLLGPFPPGDQIKPRIPAVTPRTIPQRLTRPRAKLGIRMSRRTQVFLQLKEAPDIGLKVLGVFRVDSVDFAFDAGGVKERLGEEACEAVERALQGGPWWHLGRIYWSMQYQRKPLSPQTLPTADPFCSFASKLRPTP
jgi:hypothetical protein